MLLRRMVRIEWFHTGLLNQRLHCNSVRELLKCMLKFEGHNYKHQEEIIFQWKISSSLEKDEFEY